VQKVLIKYILRYQPVVVQDRKNKTHGKMGIGLGWSAAVVIKFTLCIQADRLDDLFLSLTSMYQEDQINFIEQF
jgi:hypothetical protein